MVSQEPRFWEFQVQCPHASQVYLVTAEAGGRNETKPMESMGHGLWQLRCQLAPGAYDFHYFASDGQSITRFENRGVRVRHLPFTPSA